MDGSILKANPRTVARRQLVRLSNMGYSLCSGFETEFMIMSPDTHEPVFPSADYCETLSFKPFEEFFMDMDRHMVTAKVDLECVRVEQGPGKFEAILQTSRPGFHFKECNKGADFRQKSSCKLHG